MREPPRWRTALALLGMGIAVLLAGDAIERQRSARQPWANGILIPEGELEIEDALSIMTRRAPHDAAVSIADRIEQRFGTVAQDPVLRDALERLRENEARAEYVVFAPIPRDMERGLLSSGRFPEAGSPEVLAGTLARRDAFTLDGTTFRVVGRMDGYAAPFLFTYLLPDHEAFRPLFTAETGATRGWMHPDGGRAPVEADDASEEAGETDETKATVLGGVGLIEPMLSLMGIAGLACVACGGALLLTRVWRALHQRGVRCGTPIFEEIASRPRLWVALHMGLYALFFGAMLFGLARPLWSMTLTGLVAGIFMEGELAYIGQAYAAANIWQAALATFHHNYVTATLLFTLLASVIVPGIGVIKTAASLALVGFVMTPLWTDTLGGYSYHCVTMVLEFEAYILACFAVCVYFVCFFRGMSGGAFLAQMARGVGAMLGAALWSGLLLACAAGYEAATLILFRF